LSGRATHRLMRPMPPISSATPYPLQPESLAPVDPLAPEYARTYSPGPRYPVIPQPLLATTVSSSQPALPPSTTRLSQSEIESLRQMAKPASAWSKRQLTKQES
jgi:hypothetical protein